jgi:hypothetical protein
MDASATLGRLPLRARLGTLISDTLNIMSMVRVRFRR